MMIATKTRYEDLIP